MGRRRSHRVFAFLYEKFGPANDRAGFDAYRDRLVGGLGGRVLEVGAGTGLNLHRYEHADHVVALEPDTFMLRRLLSARDSAKVPVEVVSASAYPLPFRDGAFEAVVFCLVLCSIPDPGMALDEARRVLAPGGSIHFLEHVRAVEPRLAKWQNRAQPFWRPLGAGCHLNRDTIAVISRSYEMEELEEFDFDTGGLTVLGRPHVIGSARPR